MFAGGEARRGENMEHELADWDTDHSKTDPYQIPRSGKHIRPHPRLNTNFISSAVTMDQVRFIMASEEKERAEKGTAFVHAVSASTFLLLGIEIETLQ